MMLDELFAEIIQVGNTKISVSNALRVIEIDEVNKVITFNHPIGITVSSGDLLHVYRREE